MGLECAERVVQCGTEQCGTLRKQVTLDTVSVQESYMTLKFHPGRYPRLFHLSGCVFRIGLSLSLKKQRDNRKVTDKAKVFFLEEFLPSFSGNKQLIYQDIEKELGLVQW